MSATCQPAPSARWSRWATLGQAGSAVTPGMSGFGGGRGSGRRHGRRGRTRTRPPSGAGPRCRRRRRGRLRSRTARRRCGSMMLGEDVAGGAGHLRVMVGPVVGHGRDIQLGAVPGPADADVELLAGQLRVDQQMGVVDGEALGAVDGAGVVQLDMRRDVVGRQGDPAAVAAVRDGQGAVVVDGQDEPAVAVLHPVPAAVDREAAFVAAGRDPVPDPGGGAVPQRNPVDVDLPGQRSGRPGPGRSARRRSAPVEASSRLSRPARTSASQAA